MELQAHQNRRIFERIDDVVAWFEAGIVGLSMVVMAINMIANVFGRYVFAQSIYFSEELNEVLMIAVTFVGLGYVTRKGRHIRMSAVYDMLPAVARRWLMIVIAVSTAAALFLLAWHAFEYVQKVAMRGRVTPSMQIPLWTTYVSVVVGLFLAGIQFLLAAWANLTDQSAVWISLRETDHYEDPELAELLAHRGGDGGSVNLNAGG